MKKSFYIITLLAVSLFMHPLFGQSNAKKANYRTALRYLMLSKEYVASKNWNEVVSLSSMGIAYDESISDLWYLLAVSNSNSGQPKYLVRDQVEKALELNNWVDYNRDQARILYADILCDTGKCGMVSDLLDSTPLIFSADAEYIRAKALYRQGTEDSVEKGRQKIDSARKIYPDDKRFALLFFRQEDSESDDPKVRQIADFFISKIAQFAKASPDEDTELEIRAALFARGESQVRMLKSFNARGLVHPLYVYGALKNSLMTQSRAFDYLRKIADVQIDYSILQKIVPLFDEEDVVDKMAIYFNSFGGQILRDTDGDGVQDLYVKYLRGRPMKITYDQDHDDKPSWSVDCDFGIPEKARFHDNGMEITWDPYPYLETTAYMDESDNSLLKFTLVGESLKWTPVSIEVDETVCATGADFYFPVVLEKSGNISDSDLMRFCSSYEIPTGEREGAVIHWTILDGQVLLAQYFQGRKMYAQAKFTKGFPEFRVVDRDGDGIFETTEFYGFDRNNSREIHDLEDEKAVMTNLFGYPAESGGFYLSLIQIDMNGDTVPDWTEEYLDNNGSITSWDTNDDGLWDIRTVRYGKQLDKNGKPLPQVRDDMFYQGPQENLVVVSSVDNVPVKVISGDEELAVTKDKAYDFYWIGDLGYSDMAKNAIRKMSVLDSQGQNMMIEDTDARFLCVRIGTNYYGKIIRWYDWNVQETQESVDSGENL